MSAPVKYTCPDIDKIIADITEVVKEVQYTDNDEREALEAKLNFVDNLDKYTGRWYNPLEELRASNSGLREWGEEQEVRADDLEADVKRLECEVDVLTEENRVLKEYIEKLESQNNHLTELLHQTN